MTTRKRWIAAALVLILVSAGGVLSLLRQARVRRLSKECAVVAKREDWTRLEALAREWTDFDPSPLAWFWLATSLKEQREFAEAEHAFAKVPLDGLRGIDAATARMEILYHIDERPLEAIALARELLQLDPHLAAPRRHRIHFHAMTLQRRELIQEIRLAIRHRADVPEHYVYMLSLEDLSFRDAEQVTARWVEAAPDSAVLRQAHQMHRLRSARSQSRESPTPETIENYRQVREEVMSAVGDDTSDPVVLDSFLLLAMDSEDVDEAGRLLGLVPDQAADDPVFWRYRGWYATKIRDLAQAGEAYRQALALYPLGWQTRHEYANLLRLSGQVEEAGKVQSISAQGSELANEIRRLPHVRDVPPALLNRIARFARDCGDNEVANGIIRRYEPKNR